MPSLGASRSLVVASALGATAPVAYFLIRTVWPVVLG
jgi:hypothetical protein